MLQPEPLLDVAVANDGERGLLGTAVSRENESTTYVFLYFTESGGGVDGDDMQGVHPQATASTDMSCRRPTCESSAHA